MSKTKYQTSQADLKRITTDCVERLMKDASARPSFSVLEKLFSSRDYSTTYPAGLMCDLFSYWRDEGEAQLLFMASTSLARELEEKRKSQRKMKECFQDLLNLD